VSEDLKVRPTEVEPNDEIERASNWPQILRWTALVLVVVFAFAFILPPQFEGHLHSWFNNWRQTQYLKSHGVVVKAVATVPGPINGLGTDAAGNIYALSGPKRALIVVHPDGSQTSISIPPATLAGNTYRGPLTLPVLTHALVTLPNGTTFIADQYRGAIIRVAPDGTVNMNWVRPGALAPDLTTNASLYGDAQGNLYQPGAGAITRIAPDGSVTLNWVSSRQLASVDSLAVSPENTLFIFGAMLHGPAGRTDVYRVQKDGTVARISSISDSVQRLPGPPSLGFADFVSTPVASTDTLWVLSGDTLAKILPNAHYTSWWLTNPDGKVATTAVPFILGPDHTAYAGTAIDAATAIDKPNQSQPTTIVRFTLPTTN
jgi:sugar lactone lactonase YvrE